MHSVFNDFALNVKSLYNDNIHGSSNFQWNQCIENLVYKSTWDVKKVTRSSFSILYVFQMDQTKQCVFITWGRTIDFTKILSMIYRWFRI